MKRPDPTYLDLPDGVRLHYRIQGNPSGPWLVLLNGLLSDTTMWAGVLPGLTADFRVLTWDMRGQGRTRAPFGEAYPVAQHAEDAWALLDGLGLRRPWLVGLSNGASVSLELLSGHLGAFAGAVLTSCMPRIDFTTRLRILHWIQCLEVGGPLMQFDAVAPYLWGDRFLEQRHGVLRAYHQVVSGGRGDLRNAGAEAQETALAGARAQMAGVLDWDIRDRLDRIQDPLLLLCGAEDLLTPPWKCLESARGIPHARFEVIPGIGHAYPVEDPKAFAARLKAFVADPR